MSHRWLSVSLALASALTWPAWLASCTGDVGEPPGTGGGNGGPCADDAACDDDNPCTDDSCDEDTAKCTNEGLADQVLADDVVLGDCAASVCIAGELGSQPNDADVPTDADPCTLDLCNDGVAANFPAPAGTPCGETVVCDDGGLCVGCNGPTECPQPSNPCEMATCIGAVCGVANADGAPCTSDGVFCNGAEECQAGSCVSPGDPCDGPDGDGDCSETCSESSGNCGADDPNNSVCDDGLWCNGTDECNPNGSCSQHTGSPCPGADGDSNCVESCAESTDTCDANDPNGSTCSNGSFCDGVETCSNGSCGNSPGNPCPGPDGDSDCSETCNETLNSCTSNDPDFTDCNGIPTDTICCVAGTCTSSGNCP